MAGNAVFICVAWVNTCPLIYTSPNAPSKRDVLGTWLLAILAGHKRYAHITGLRGDAVSPQILGMDKIISEDALRRSLARMSEQQSQAWLAPQLMGSVQAALSTPWILDIDTTIKPLYGKQSGAQVSYNPHKPGAAPATPCTPSGWATCAWCWTWWSHRAKNTVRPKRAQA